MEPSGALAPFLTAPERAAVLLDFDGTLSPIVQDAAAARPLPGAADVLVALAARFGQVAVVSGRPVSYLEAHLPAELTLVGLYGLERRVDGVVVEHPGAAGWRTVVDEVVQEAQATGPEGVDVEHKGLSLTLHVRRSPERAAAARRWAVDAAERTGLELRTAKMSVELHPPVTVDKGTVVTELVGDLPAACFVGDDVGDLPAFVALARLATEGRHVLRVVVDSPEVTPEVLEVADLRVPGPEGALAFLQELSRPR